MSVKAKTKKRLVLLVGAVVGVAALLAGGLTVKAQRNAAYFAGERALGLKCATDGDAQASVIHLAKWLSRNPDDVEVLTVYAQQRLMTESPDGTNVWDAVGRLRHLVELRPDADEPRRQLMQLYARYGFTTEAKDTARAVAISKWPHMADQFARKKDIDRAEAALIGWAGLQREAHNV